jgi:hypothetical protein
MREKKAALLRPLVQRMHLGHCWVKTKDGPRRIDEPFTEVKLSEHVMGSAAYGLCPIAPGTSTTMVACFDLDSHKGETPWRDMVETAGLIVTSLEMDGYWPTVFRSSGGSGIHIIVTWDHPQDAYSVREWARAHLAGCGLTVGTKGVAALQVEVFPKQDSVPADGYGSMFILPLSGKSELLAL